MNDNTPITWALRDYIERHPTMMHAVGLTDLCDNIDVINEALEDEYAEMRTFVESLDDAAKKHEDLTLWGADYMALPLDADMVPIHVGDVMKGGKVGGGFGEPFKVVGYIMSNGELEPMDEHGCPRKHEYLRHHHEPTVEDVLWEFTRAILNQKVECREQNIAKYAAKLRLAGDAE